MLDDPSPKVRLALAEGLADDSRVPRPVLLSLCEDSPAIAGVVASRSPALRDDELIDLAASGPAELRTAIAARRRVSTRVAAAIAEVAEPGSCITLLENQAAAIAGVSFRRIAERHGANASVRGALLDRSDLPATVRQTMILCTGQALAALPILRNLVGADRAERTAFDACERATALLAETVPEVEIPALVEHLRASGQLNVAFLLRTVCAGNIDLFAAALVRLSSMSERRVRSILAEGRDGAFRTMITRCGLPSVATPLFLIAVGVWREIASGKRVVAVEGVPQLIMQRLVAASTDRSRTAGFEAMMRFLYRLAGETERDAAREQARSLAA
nr:DUF2336 domain-containing protein [Aurantimonas marina]